MIYGVIFVVIIKGVEVDIGVLFQGGEEGGDDVGFDVVCYCVEFFGGGYGGVIFYGFWLGEKRVEREGEGRNGGIQG